MYGSKKKYTVINNVKVQLPRLCLKTAFIYRGMVHPNVKVSLNRRI